MTWNWPPDPVFGSLADILGFKVYSGPSQPQRGWTDGTVQAVSEAVPGDPVVPNGLPVFHANTSLVGTGIDLTTLALESVRVGTDHYVVCDGAVSNQGNLNLRLYVNLSNPTQRPSVGDPIRVFDSTSDPNQFQQAAAYSNSFITVPNTGLQTTLQVYVTAGNRPDRSLRDSPTPMALSRLTVGVSALQCGREAQSPARWSSS